MRAGSPGLVMYQASGSPRGGQRPVLSGSGGRCQRPTAEVIGGETGADTDRPETLSYQITREDAAA